MIFGVSNIKIVNSATVTIAEAITGFGTAHEQQSKVFQNPRGQNYYYALFEAPPWGNSTIFLSEDGLSWTHLFDFPTITAYNDWTIWEDTTGGDTRLIVIIASSETGSQDVHVTAYYIDDADTDFIFLWDKEVQVKQEDVCTHVGICIDDDGYIWVSNMQEYTKQGKQRIDVWIHQSQTAYPETEPNFAGVMFYDGSALTGNPDERVYSKPVPLFGMSIDVGIVFHVWEIGGSKLYALNATRGNPPTIGDRFIITTDLVFLNGKFSATYDLDNQVYVFIHEDEGLDEPLVVYRWNTTDNSASTFGDVLEVDAGPLTYASGVIGCIQSQDPNLLYAVWWNTTIGEFYYSTSNVTLADWSLPIMIEDEVSDYNILCPSISPIDYVPNELPMIYCSDFGPIEYVKYQNFTFQEIDGEDGEPISDEWWWIPIVIILCLTLYLLSRYQ